jgi:hypothetical protein
LSRVIRYAIEISLLGYKPIFMNIISVDVWSDGDAMPSQVLLREISIYLEPFLTLSSGNPNTQIKKTNLMLF